LIFGDAEVVTRMRRHPLARAVRVDKLTLAALEATLDGPATPTHQALHADADALRARCERVARAIGELVPADVVAVAGAVGGGGAPGVPLPGWAIALPDSFAQRLRAGDPPVIGRVERGRCLLDLRCVPESDEAAVVSAVRVAASDVQG
jgi:L-seryl-tRNA(Ser) seleniumtransferase